MMEEDLSIFFDDSELGDLCLIDGREVVGIFSSEGLVTEEIEGEVPVLLVSADEVPAVEHGTTVQAPKVDGRSYVVRQVLPDSTGRVVRLVLEET